jgi:hypothetical protein
VRYRIEIREGMRDSYHAMRRRLAAEGKSQEQIDEEFNAIALAHNGGRSPSGAAKLKPTPKGRERYGLRVLGVPLTYHVRPPDRIVIEDIRVDG